ncbi:MAG: hypothetical protein ABI577_18280 [bacterium]
MDKDYPVYDITPELAAAEDASRHRAPKASFRRFDVLLIGGLCGAALAWGGYLAWGWWL